ncbi:hypothetical protein [Rathayibacter sp. VKM Ac-2803]|nr:hypothetical protein [Rathayibacter sp. VKM Ac-2803]
MHPGSVLEYRFDGHQRALLNRVWLRELLGPTLSRDMVLSVEPV